MTKEMPEYEGLYLGGMRFQQKYVHETICSFVFLYSMKLNYQTIFHCEFFISFYQYFHESDIDFINGQSSAIAFSGRHVI